jgi:hypothetical protein
MAPFPRRGVGAITNEKFLNNKIKAVPTTEEERRKYSLSSARSVRSALVKLFAKDMFNEEF